MVSLTELSLPTLRDIQTFSRGGSCACMAGILACTQLH